MYPIEIVIASGIICYLIGFFSRFIFDKKDVSLEKQVAVIILFSWLAFAMLAYLQDKELSIFFNASGIGAVGNLLGIKTSEMVSGLIKRK